jgi:hypothetical protein
VAAEGFLSMLTKVMNAVFGSTSTPTAPSPSRREPAGRKPVGRPTPKTIPPHPRTPTAPSSGDVYPGDFTGVAELEYAPRDDGLPDPGEVVWAWVPFEEDHSQGKDRPVLVIAKDGGYLLGLMLTSKDHDRDQEQEARHGRYWFDVGTGAWDRQGRPSEVRVDRVLRLDPSAVRREGAALDRDTYQRLATEVRRVLHW